MKKPPVKFPDILIIVISASFIFFSAYSVYIKPRGNAQVFIRGDGAEWVFPLDAEETISVQGPLGNTVIFISGSRTWIDSSPCDNQNCVIAGPLSQESQWAACLPNLVLLVIQGSGGEYVDALAW